MELTKEEKAPTVADAPEVAEGGAVETEGKDEFVTLSDYLRKLVGEDQANDAQ